MLLNQKHNHCSGGSRISSRWGRQPSGGQPSKFSQKLHEIERILTPGGVPPTPLDPPLHWPVWGALGTRIPCMSNFFHFHAVLAKILPNNRLVHPLREIMDPPLAIRVEITNYWQDYFRTRFLCVWTNPNSQKKLLFTCWFPLFELSKALHKVLIIIHNQ